MMNFKKLVLFGGFVAICGLNGCALAPTREVISTSNAPSAIGPYSQAVKVGGVLYVSGQISIDPKTGQVIIGSIEEQTKLVLENIKAILSANSMSMHDVVSTTVYIKDLNDFSKMNEIYGGYFNKNPPARSTIQAARLPRDVAIEISVIAVK
jgi:2-iminobutanoate/2-iminopropanoate deaminase